VTPYGRLMSDAVVIEAAGREVQITSPDKVFFEERGDTKLDLVRYYDAIAPAMLPIPPSTAAVNALRPAPKPLKNHVDW